MPKFTLCQSKKKKKKVERGKKTHTTLPVIRVLIKLPVCEQLVALLED